MSLNFETPIERSVHLIECLIVVDDPTIHVFTMFIFYFWPIIPVCACCCAGQKQKFRINALSIPRGFIVYTRHSTFEIRLELVGNHFILCLCLINVQRGLPNCRQQYNHLVTANNRRVTNAYMTIPTASPRHSQSRSVFVNAYIIIKSAFREQVTPNQTVATLIFLSYRYSSCFCYYSSYTYIQLYIMCQSSTQYFMLMHHYVPCLSA